MLQGLIKEFTLSQLSKLQKILQFQRNILLKHPKYVWSFLAAFFGILASLGVVNSLYQTFYKANQLSID